MSENISYCSENWVWSVDSGLF